MLRFLVFVLCGCALAQVKHIPPPGIAISEADRAELTGALAKLKPRFDSSLDLQIRWKAVDWALRYNEFFKPEDVARARQILNEAFGQPGLIVHGFRSEIDDSLQPYGLVIPPSYSPNAKGKWRLDVWLHGRGETTTELAFIHDRLTKRGEFTPADTIVLHPFGRYCNAFKFAGETDVFEAIEDVSRRYSIDPDRIAIRGFSMGGAGAWHLAAHHPGEWAAANPGAGFVDTEEYQKLRAKNAMPSEWQQTLWRMTNAKEYAVNFFNVPVVAYSGEDDAQKAAADIMGREMAASGLTLAHVIGPKTGHKYEPVAKADVARRFDALMARGRQFQPRVRFVTYTTRYNHSHWVLIHELKQHWQRAEVDAAIVNGGIEATTKNVGRIEFYFRPGECPFPQGQPIRVKLDGKTFEGAAPLSDLSCKWHSPGSDAAVYKRPGLQGPIDDAFTSRFVFVTPSESAPAWVKSEYERARGEWRALFRGDALVVEESAVTPELMRSANLVLWGTPQSNALIAKWPAPIAWPEDGRMLLAIYPNPEAPNRYIVLNSGFTFREEAYGTNAQQTAKLPDWAVVEAPYKVVRAGFFDESWKARP